MKRLLLIIAMFFIVNQNFSQSNNQMLPNDIKATIGEPKEQQSKISAIKDWIIPISASITMLSVAFGVFQSLREYRLKLKAESRIAESTAVEMDIKLMQGFTNLLALAHARKGNYLSEKTVEKMFDKELFTSEELQNPILLNQKISSAAVVNVPSGIAEQTAFVSALAELGLKHKILRLPVIQALETMQSFIPDIANKYLAIMNSNNVESLS